MIQLAFLTIIMISYKLFKCLHNLFLLNYYVSAYTYCDFQIFNPNAFWNP